MVKIGTRDLKIALYHANIKVWPRVLKTGLKWSKSMVQIRPIAIKIGLKWSNLGPKPLKQPLNGPNQSQIRQNKPGIGQNPLKLAKSRSRALEIALKWSKLGPEPSKQAWNGSKSSKTGQILAKSTRNGPKMVQIRSRVPETGLNHGITELHFSLHTQVKT